MELWDADGQGEVGTALAVGQHLPCCFPKTSAATTGITSPILCPLSCNQSLLGTGTERTVWQGFIVHEEIHPQCGVLHPHGVEGEQEEGRKGKQ